MTPIELCLVHIRSPSLRLRWYRSLIVLLFDDQWHINYLYAKPFVPVNNHQQRVCPPPPTRHAHARAPARKQSVLVTSCEWPDVIWTPGRPQIYLTQTLACQTLQGASTSRYSQDILHFILSDILTFLHTDAFYIRFYDFHWPQV